MDLNQFWFVLLGVLLTGYAILDGFDLGVGILHPFARRDEERRIFLNSIGPLWDGNEVWLVTFGGAMFAAFPHAYATIFSGFYLAFVLLLFALISRAVSIEYRGKRESPRWRHFFDYTFFAGSAIASLLFGVGVGNAMSGMAVDADMNYTGGFLSLLRPYPLLVGLFTVATFAMHGAIYLYLKTSGDLQKRIHGWMWRTFGLFLVMYLLTTIYTLITVKRCPQFRAAPWLDRRPAQHLAIAISARVTRAAVLCLRVVELLDCRVRVPLWRGCFGSVVSALIRRTASIFTTASSQRRCK